jgi:hypothetical protein
MDNEANKILKMEDSVAIPTVAGNIFVWSIETPQVVYHNTLGLQQSVWHTNDNW